MDWSDSPKLSVQHMKYGELTAAQTREIRKLLRSATGEILRSHHDDHEVFLAYKKGTRNAKLAGFAMISPFSPAHHFENETVEDEKTPATRVPYLYNYVCDSKLRALKASVSLMYAVKNFINGVPDNYYTTKSINLDVQEHDEHARQFFERNGFAKIDTWVCDNNHNKRYTCHTCVYPFETIIKSEP